MKLMNLNKWTTIIMIALVFTNCQKEDVVDNNTQQQDELEISRSAEIDMASSMIGDIVIVSVEGQEATETGRQMPPDGLPECVTLTIVAQQNFREITLDFGEVGCMVNGHLLRGTIVLSYDRNPVAQQMLITYTLVDFYLDAKNIIGTKTILRELSNENGNPQFTHTLDLTVIWPDGTQASREGLRVREWVEGFGSGLWSDNVFQVTGNWTTTFVNGNSHNYETITPLRREAICYFFVSGTVDVQRTNFGGVLDYGDGDCDNQATFTFNNGETINITLN